MNDFGFDDALAEYNAKRVRWRGGKGESLTLLMIYAVTMPIPYSSGMTDMSLSTFERFGAHGSTSRRVRNIARAVKDYTLLQRAFARSGV